MRAARFRRETFCECIMAVWCRPSSTFSASASALSKSLTLTTGSIGISCSLVTHGSSALTIAISRRGAFAGTAIPAASSIADGLLPTSFLLARPSGRQAARSLSVSAGLSSSAPNDVVTAAAGSATAAARRRLAFVAPDVRRRSPPQSGSSRQCRAGCNRTRRR